MNERSSHPDDILLEILACVPRCDYQTLSVVSKHIQSLVVTPELYSRRSLLRCTNGLYILVNSGIPSDRLCILHQKALVHISSHSDVTVYQSFVGLVRGFICLDYSGDVSSIAFSIDCRSDTVQRLPKIPKPLQVTVAYFMDGKIYLFGQCNMKSTVMVVFDTNTQMWEPGFIKTDTSPEASEIACTVVMMADKIYIRCNLNSFIYVPKEIKWGKDEILDSMDWDGGNQCIFYDVLYYYNDHEDCLRVYDPEQMCWGW